MLIDQHLLPKKQMRRAVEDLSFGVAAKGFLILFGNSKKRIWFEADLLNGRLGDNLDSWQNLPMLCMR